ncbi:MAG TPA: Glu-tRNA(Gln) amidotransferase subunit GatD [Candidatus Thermoplasmatota archaeon]
MPRDPAVDRMIAAAGAKPGDLVEVVVRGHAHRGLLMPHTDSADPECAVVKLDSGYNVGVRLAGGSIRLIESREAKGYAEAAAPEAPAKVAEGFIALIGTGGTIASYVDYDTGAVHPALTTRELATAVPEVMARYPLRPVALFSEFSENLRPEHWVKIAHEVKRQVEEGATGVIIPHGTDTLTYTAAALAFMIENPPVPIVLVGSQRSSDRPSSDATFNLLCAALVATSDIAEVVAVMHNRTGDEVCAVHLGPRVRKMHASARAAFRSVNVPPLALTDGRRVEPVHGAHWRKRSDGRKVILRDKLAEPVALLQYYPGMPESLLRSAIAGSKGLVLAGSGLGHVAEDLLPTIQEATARGFPVVVTTQCIYGRTGLHVYSSGRNLLEAGVIDAGDMLTEAAVVKLMWAVAHARGPADVRKLMETNLVGEVAERRVFEGSGEDER